MCVCLGRVQVFVHAWCVCVCMFSVYVCAVFHVCLVRAHMCYGCVWKAEDSFHESVLST